MRWVLLGLVSLGVLVAVPALALLLVGLVVAALGATLSKGAGR